MSATHDYAGISTWNFKMTVEVHSFEQARDAFWCPPEGAKWYQSFGVRDLIIGPNMYLRPNFSGREQAGIPTRFAIRLYNTEIIRYYPDGTFSVDNGGFNTPTTTERLQVVLPDGFRCYHFSTREIKGKLGLTYRGSPWPKRRKVQTPDTLWPLDHTKWITLDGRFA
jgi:hypothetical protein